MRNSFFIRAQYKRVMKLSTLFAVLFLLMLQFSAVLAEEVVNDITQLNPIRVERVRTPISVKQLQTLIANHHGPISVGGGRYSQGGQTASENGLFLDMRGLNRVLNLDVKKRLITVEAGATWRKIQETIDPHDLSIKIMQSYSNFTVGGSLSVNVHGRYVGEGPLIRSVESIKIILADGSIKEASRTQNSDLFFAAIGGYGGIGVITEATLKLTENMPVERTVKKMDTAEYKDYFFKHIRKSKSAIFHNANLYPPDYSQLSTTTWSTTDKPVTVSERLAQQEELSWAGKNVLKLMSTLPPGSRLREYIYDPYATYTTKIVWRNYEASHDVRGLEPTSRKKSTYVLQEYFIPVATFDAFVPKLAAILKNHKVRVINLSVRHALPDKESLLSWAPTEVFAFVLYYEQGVTDGDKKKVYDWTSELIDAALKEGGRYYLPYQIIATKKQFLKAYPRAPEYFAIKKRVDPTYKFRNKLWDRYYSE